jgi:oxalate decarboxylase/phosphoglucose isomerase-like protein (cupin superfamily)
VISIKGERMVILEPDSADSEDVLVLDVIREPHPNPDYSLPPEHGHFHPKQEERFEIISGKARFLIGDEYVELSPSEVGAVPPNTLHHWMALGGRPVRVRAIFEPSLDVDMWFLHFQKYIAAGEMDFLQAAVITREYGDSSPMPASPPPAVWNALSRILAPLGRLLGYEAC